ncbi:hypothetical protein BGW80DRAFT_212203 [Lactifluus volemus]|nr:hypothetical protein BGW80DRAFT_212203 [Lactifluus volemus]
MCKSRNVDGDGLNRSFRANSSWPVTRPSYSTSCRVERMAERGEDQRTGSRRVVFPLSIVRYSTFADKSHPIFYHNLVDIIYLSSGLSNALLFSRTRPFMLPHDIPIPGTTTETTRASLPSRPRSAKV